MTAHEADHHRDRAALPEDVDPEVADGAIEMGEVHLELVLELARLLLAHELVRDPPHGLDIHRLRRNRRDDAVDLDVDRRPARNEQVGGLLFRHQSEKSIEVHVGASGYNRGTAYIGSVATQVSMIMS